MQSRNILLIVGSGAVQNSWEPVIRATNQTFGIQTDADGVNFLMASHVCLLKFYAEVTSKGGHLNVYEIQKSNVCLIKRNICNELKKAQDSGELKARPQLDEILKRFVTPYPSDKAKVITTNWDEVIDIEVRKFYQNINPINKEVSIMHIHGAINTPEHMYLPTEVTGERYRIAEERKRFGLDHSDLMHLLLETNRTVLYGISLDPLDAELCLSLAAGWNSPILNEIIIINPQHEKVAKRVKLLLEIHSIAKVIGYHPENLNEKIAYN
ncbi:MAG TPA: hypothetical protein VFG10_13985 [Saprospiraceae bacterium]|nr:hypothetical protein [Saprospiraceae bacterium]